MRIGMMADIYTPHISGVTHHIALNKECFEQAGHECYVFTFGENLPDDEACHVVRSPGVPIRDTGYNFGLWHTRTARHLIESMDLVHVHHPFVSGQLAIHYCRPKRIPIVYTNHSRYDLFARAYVPVLPDQVGEAILQMYFPSFCRDVDLVIAPSEGVKGVMRQLGVDAPIEVIPNGVRLAGFRREVSPIERSCLGVAPEDVLIIYVGRLSPEKNLPTLLQAFLGVEEAYRHVRLLVVGAGPEYDELRHEVSRCRAPDKIVFSGSVPYDEVPSYLAAADIFATSSVAEVHPLSVMEAMAAGLPVVGIDAPGVGDVVIDGFNGLLSTNDIASFTAHLARLVGDSDLRRRLASSARISSDAFDIDRTSGLLLRRYGELIRAKEASQEPTEAGKASTEESTTLDPA
jgi:glycosyltransferase involved in cell wall biosynthesis